MLKRVMLLSLTLVLNGCALFGPSVHYEYHAPKSVKGKKCVARCERKKARCQRLDSKAYQHCEYRSKMLGLEQYKVALEEYNIKKARGEDPIEPSRWQFSNPLGCRHERNCKANYDRCFKACGGKIERIVEESR